MKRRKRFLAFLFVLHWSLVTGSLITVLVGCESLQKKFVRKPKPHVRPSPIISFQDYSRALTPLDRYRKHYTLFEYWNAQLLEELKASPINPKRAKQASTEALQELKILHGLLQNEMASQAGRMIEERARFDRQIQSGLSNPSQLGAMGRALEVQTRQIHRELFWRKVEDRLKESATSDASPD